MRRAVVLGAVVLLTFAAVHPCAGQTRRGWSPSRSGGWGGGSSSRSNNGGNGGWGGSRRTNPSWTDNGSNGRTSNFYQPYQQPSPSVTPSTTTFRPTYAPYGTFGGGRSAGNGGFPSSGLKTFPTTGVSKNNGIKATPSSGGIATTGPGKITKGPGNITNPSKGPGNKKVIVVYINGNPLSLIPATGGYWLDPISGTTYDPQSLGVQPSTDYMASGDEPQSSDDQMAAGDAGGGAPITLLNPTESQGTVNFTLGADNGALQPGYTAETNAAAPQLIVFDRGGNFGQAQYTLSPGATYRFASTDQGWVLRSVAN
jgi:hypothetical protein